MLPSAATDSRSDSDSVFETLMLRNDRRGDDFGDPLGDDGLSQACACEDLADLGEARGVAGELFPERFCGEATLGGGAREG